MLRHLRGTGGRSRVRASNVPVAPVVTSADTSRVGGRVLLVVVAVAVVVAALTAAGLTGRRTIPVAGPQSEMRVDLATPPTTDPFSFEVSPDGRRVTFVATFDGRARLWLRDVHETKARPLAATDFAAQPFWSPDSRSIGFFAESKLKRLDVETGTVQSLAAIRAGLGGTWGHDHAILFSGGVTGPIWRVADTGGEPQAVTDLRPPQTGHRFPHVLPDNRHFIYFAAGPSNAGHVFVARLDGSDPRQLMTAESSAVYLPSGHLLYVTQGTLYAVAFDLAQLSLADEPMLIAKDVAQNRALGSAAVSASTTGLILYRHASTALTRQFSWFDRKGVVIGPVGEADHAGPAHPSLAANGKDVALTRVVNGNADVWRLDPANGRSSRVTQDDSAESYPVWSPDGKQIVFSSQRSNGPPALIARAMTGSASDQPFGPVEGFASVTPDDWSPDGQFVVFSGVPDLKASGDIWALPVKAPRTPVAVANTRFEEGDAQVSPDGRWVAYHSDESGRVEVYVQPFLRLDQKVMVSGAGGAQVRWRRDGTELFYVALDGRLMAVPIRSTTSVINAGSPVPLFAIDTASGLPGQGNGRPQYAVSPDGERFLVHAFSSEDASPIVMVVQWKPGS